MDSLQSTRPSREKKILLTFNLQDLETPNKRTSLTEASRLIEPGGCKKDEIQMPDANILQRSCTQIKGNLPSIIGIALFSAQIICLFSFLILELGAVISYIRADN